MRESLESAKADARRTPVRVAVWYALFGVVWIFASDLIVSALLGASAEAYVAHILKGLAFIALSSWLVYVLSKWGQRRLSETLRRAEQAEGLFLEAQRTEALAASVAQIVHDFRNNLAVVTGFSELVARNLEDDAHAVTYVAHIQQAARSAHTLSANLLELASGNMGDGGPDARDTDASAAVHRIADLLPHLCGDKIKIETSTDGDSCLVPLSAVAIEQVLMNLAINSRDAMPDGGTLAIHIKRETNSTGEQILTLTVSDTGTGIDPEHLDRIFDPYFTTKPRGKGTGLGLSAVRVIVEQTGGSLSFESTIGKGSTFHVKLPLTATSLRVSGLGILSRSSVEVKEASPRTNVQPQAVNPR